MKKLFIFLYLLSTQAACVSQAPAPDEAGVLLSFNDLASEISVGFEARDATEADVQQGAAPLGTP